MNRKLWLMLGSILFISILVFVIDSAFLRLVLVLLLLLPVIGFWYTKKSVNLDLEPQESVPVVEELSTSHDLEREHENNIANLKQAYRKKLGELRALVRNVQQANNTASSLGAMAESQKTAIESILSDSTLIKVNANQAYAIADNIAGSANQAFELSGHVQEKVMILASQMTESLKETEFLIEESQKISGILEMMNQIASSTHVLSINASIVAARAGVHGRAFDVVSKEIRALAQNTASSLANIETIIHEIQSRILSVAERTKDSSQSILGEKDSLLSVAGSLQGVILAVEVIRTVSSMSSEKADQLQKDANGIYSSLDLLASNVSKTDTLTLTTAVFKKIDELETSLDT